MRSILEKSGAAPKLENHSETLLIVPVSALSVNAGKRKRDCESQRIGRREPGKGPAANERPPHRGGRLAVTG